MESFKSGFDGVGGACEAGHLVEKGSGGAVLVEVKWIFSTGSRCEMWGGIGDFLGGRGGGEGYGQGGLGWHFWVGWGDW